jgi:uncharacterized membrane protein
MPSSDPFFLTTVGVHIAFGLVAVLSGAVAMLSRKGRGRHFNVGTVYFRAQFGVFATTSVLSLIRWAADYYLFILGALSFASVYLGRKAIRRCLPRWHLAGMASSYVLMRTAFYADNGKNLPFWRELPQIALWFTPSPVGVPLTTYDLFRLPRFTPPPERSAKL